jgi:excinuclease UvrABC nuclease subunit
MTESFTPEQLRALTRPCVYTFVKDGKPLYIGSSAVGLTRVASPTHHKRDIREHADEIVLEWCDNPWQARAFEEQRIKEHRPPFNGNRRAFADLDHLVEQKKERVQ